MAFQLFTPQQGGRKTRSSKPQATLGRNGKMYLNKGVVLTMGLSKGSRAEVLVDTESTRIALRLGGESMNGASRALTVRQNGALFDLKAALKGSGFGMPAASIRLMPTYENGLWVFALPESMKAKA